MAGGGHDPSAPESSAARCAQRWVAWSLRRAPALAVAALVIVVPGTWLTARLYRNLSSDVEELLPRQAPSVIATDELRARVPGLSTLGVVVDAGRADQVPAAERLLDELAARVRNYPAALVHSVRVGAADEKRFFEQFGPLYIQPSDLSEIQHRIQSRKSWEARRKLDILLDDEPAPPLDFSDLQQKYRRQLPGTAGTEARFSSTDGAVSVLLIEGTEKTARLAGARQLVSRVEADLRQLGGPQHYAPGMRVGLAGNVAVSVEELQALSEDLGISTVIVVSTVLVVILLFFGWWIAIPALLIPLAIGTVAAFGIAAALPLGIDRLNSSTAFLGSIVVGNGVNFGIVWLARYAEARRRAVPVEPALAQALAGALPGTLVAALAAATSYGSLAVTHFRGFRQFGFIGGIGMLTAWVSAFLLTPPLVAWLERRAGRVGRRRVPRRSPSPSGTSARTTHPAGPAATASSSREGLGTLSGFPETVDRWPARVHRRAGEVGRFTRLLERRAVLIVAAAAALTAGACIEISHFDSSRIESDFSRLRRRDTGTSGEGYWGRKMEEVLKRNLSPTVILADSVADARGIAARVRGNEQQPRMAELIAQVRDVDDVVPPDQPTRIAEIERIRGMITPVVRAQLSPESERLVDHLLGQGPLRPVQLADVPSSLTAGLRERDGSLGRTVLVFPQLTKRLWQTAELAFLVGTLRSAAALGVAPGHHPGRVAGYVPIASDITRALQHDGPIASAIAFISVAVLVMLIFRGRSTGLWVLGSLSLGVVWMLAATLASGMKINYINFVAFPITFGIGVDYAVNIMARYRQELAVLTASSAPSLVGVPAGGMRIEAIRRAVHTTGPAVALCSLTTILGYSSLLIAKNRALSSFGAVAVSGEVSCLSTAVAVLPAALILLCAVGARQLRYSGTNR